MGELTPEARMTAALWSLQGIGPKTIAQVRRHFGADYGAVLDRPLSEWKGAIAWKPAAFLALEGVERLSHVAERLEQRVRAYGYAMAFPGDPAWPHLLTAVENAPPVLFLLGPGAAAPPRFRAAMVGSRHPEAGFLPRARQLAREVAALGIGVVSGGAEGVDSACHFGALGASGETWAFLGAALEELDPPQRALARPFLDGKGTLFSEFPPGTRPCKANFPRRNRLISGAAGVTVVLRGDVHSGSIHTARSARNQGRPILAVPGDPANPKAFVPNRLIRDGDASACLSAADVARALGLSASPKVQVSDEPTPPSSIETLSQRARALLEVLSDQARDFDDLLSMAGLESGALSGALTELELSGHVVQRVGRRYERVS